MYSEYRKKKKKFKKEEKKGKTEKGEKKPLHNSLRTFALPPPPPGLSYKGRMNEPVR